VRIVMALLGAAIVLWPEGGGAPLPRSLAEWLGVLGGFTFALNNVMLRREAARPEAARALAMFLGGALVAGAAGLALSAQGLVPGMPAPAAPWLLGVLGLGLAFLVGNAALQFGAARLPANVTAVIMITEVLFASVSAALFGAGHITLPLALGGTLIIGATLLSARG
jgi:drug/metabolite transporter (DMT)-like permease